MFCKNCGKEISDQSILCPFCGTGTLCSPVAVKPVKLSIIGGLRLASGVLNILAGLGFFWLCLPFFLIPLGIVEIISAANLLRDKPEYPVGLQPIAILEIVALCTCFTAWFTVIVGIVTLVLASDPAVRAYFDSYFKGPAPAPKA
jgi:hypothetical protein